MSSRLPVADAASTGAAAPWTAARARAWLRSDAIVDPSGAVFSWHNPRHPGFDYPEVAGLWLSAFAGGETPGDELAHRVAARLAVRVADGHVGRHGIGYTFDLGVALAGLLDHARAGGHEHQRACARGQGALTSAIAERRATTEDLAARWSTRYGPHLLKLAAVLVRLPGAEAVATRARLFDDLADRREGGRYLTGPTDDDPTYLHAHCYAAEGLWCIAHAEGDPVRARAASIGLAAAADWLADAQRADGGMPSHHDGVRGRGPARADATAQAVRIWTIAGGERHAASLALARRWLAMHTTSVGALRYEPGSGDLNAWATIFALQAALPTLGRTELPW